ncbi:MAG: SGNH/GDSL hydrolase family protein [Anaerolineales bacterium]|nr:SGNH/GDSL hydrolase family protein [Anaerolineales bacterium]
MYKVRNAVLFLMIAVLAACSDTPKTNDVEVIATSTQNEITPLATETLTQVPESTPRPTLGVDEWKSFPIVPTISDTAREIYQRGLEMGNDPNAFSKVGDCQTNTSFYLVDFDYANQYSLGEDYAYLQETIDHYEGSFSRTSLAMRDGYNVAAILTPLRADPKQCESGESPIACEFRLYNPSVALISLETNFNDRSADDYGKYMRQIVEYTIEQGVVPILATKADNKEGDHSINAEIAEITLEYDIPLWNVWAAIDVLPNHGFDTELNDGFHLSFSRNFFDKPKNMLSGWPWRNLTALQALNAVREGLNQ